MGFFSKLFGGGDAKAKDAETPASADETDDETDDDAFALADVLDAVDSADGGARVDGSALLVARAREGRDPEAVAALVARWPKLLADPEDQVRRRALTATGIVPASPERDLAAFALLDDKHPQVRAQAVWTAAQLALGAWAGRVKGRLGDASAMVRFAAAAALAQAQDAAGFDELVAALDDPTTRLEAIQALADLGSDHALAPLHSLFERPLLDGMDKVQCAGALAKLGDEAGRAHLLDALDGNDDLAPLAAGWLGDLGVTEAISKLEALAEDPSSMARGPALQALAALHADGAEARLVRVLSDDGEETEARLDAAEGLALLATPGARNALEETAGRAQDDELRGALEDILQQLEVRDQAQAAQAAQAAAKPPEAT